MRIAEIGVYLFYTLSRLGLKNSIVLFNEEEPLAPYVRRTRVENFIIRNFK